MIFPAPFSLPHLACNCVTCTCSNLPADALNLCIVEKCFMAGSTTVSPGSGTELWPMKNQAAEHGQAPTGPGANTPVCLGSNACL